jgi:Spy/CpxP family protein refolding chaperone
MPFEKGVISMKRVFALIVAVGLLAPAGAGAQQPHPPSGHGGQVGHAAEMAHQGPHDALARFVFPPELVMQHQRAIGLKPEQRTAITRAVGEFQPKVTELQWQMQDESQQLAELLDKSSVDQAAVLAQVDKVLALEREVKRAHMSLLIQIKNTLTQEQQVTLRNLRVGGAGFGGRP